jgi:hypothetical protein
MQRGSDPQDADIWLIETREGPIFGRFYPDGRRVFVRVTEARVRAEITWRRWAEADHPAVDEVWESFAAWWADQGYTWPPD